MALRVEQAPLVLESAFGSGHLRAEQASLVIEVAPLVLGHMRTEQVSLILEIPAPTHLRAEQCYLTFEISAPGAAYIIPQPVGISQYGFPAAPVVNSALVTLTGGTFQDVAGHPISYGSIEANLIVGSRGPISGFGNVNLSSNVITWTGGPLFTPGMVGQTLILIGSGGNSVPVLGFIDSTHLQLGAVINPGGAVVWTITIPGPADGLSFTIPLGYDGSVVPGSTIHATDTLPPGTYYSLQLFDYSGLMVWSAPHTMTVASALTGQGNANPATNIIIWTSGPLFTPSMVGQIITMVGIGTNSVLVLGFIDPTHLQLAALFPGGGVTWSFVLQNIVDLIVLSP